ncbi:MAG: EF-hand domain-containing protein [Hyphomicrobiaceae bacterium]
MVSKRVWIVAGVLVVGAGLTAAAAHSYRDRDRHSGGHFEDGGPVPGEHHGRWLRGALSKSDYDAQTRARFAQMDADSDGTVSADEAKARVEQRMGRDRRWRRRGERKAQRMIRRFDTDKDGKVTRSEFNARVGERFERGDLDGDGSITDQDLPPLLRDRGVLSGRVELPRSHGHGFRRGRAAHRILRFVQGADANGDGAITLEEASVAAGERFDRFDRNDDGVVDRADFDALKNEILDYRVRRMLHRFGVGSDGLLTRDQFAKFRDDRFARLDYNNDGELSQDELFYGHRRHWGKRGARHKHRGRHHKNGSPRSPGNEGQEGRDGRRL